MASMTCRLDGPALRRRRELAGMSLGDLAQRCSEVGYPVHSTLLGTWERGLHNPRPRGLRVLAEVFGVEPEELLFEDAS